MSRPDPEQTDLDRAVAARLARLGRCPVDTSALERRLSVAIREQSPPERLPFIRVLRPWRSVVSAAAVLAMCALVTVVILSARSAMPRYTAAEVVLAHQHYLDASPHLLAVSTAHEANSRCQELWADAPAIPGLPDVEIECCCVHDFARCAAACLHFEYEGVPVTMAVMKEGRLDESGATIVHHEGRRYLAKTTGGYEILAMSDADRSVCLIAKLPRESLLRLAAGFGD